MAATTGLPRSVRDIAGYRYGFGHDNALRLVTDTSLAGTASPAVTTRTYDDESRPIAHVMMRAGVPLAIDGIRYDVQGRITRSASQADGQGPGPRMHYAPLGPMTAASDQGAFFNDSVAPDPSGTPTPRSTPGVSPGSRRSPTSPARRSCSGVSPSRGWAT